MIDAMKTIRGIVALGLAVGLSCSQAFAELPEKPGPIVNADKPTLAYVVAVVLLLCAGAVAFKPAKRSHLD